jgi:DUF1680 family protein
MSRRHVLPVLVVACISLGVACSGPKGITNAVPDVARPLPLPAVRLTGGPLKHAQDLNAQYLLSLEPDRMLAYYRKHAGLEPKAEPYGGWDGDGRNLTGHIAGHYLSGVSLMWAATGDPRFKERVDYIVSELKVVQETQKDGFVGALAGVREAFADVSKGQIKSANFDLNGLWSPWYTLHKTYAGLRDAYRHAGNRTALDLEVKFAEWAERVLAPMNDAQIQQMLGTEFGGMNEVLADLYADTADRRWLALSYRFEHNAVLDPLKRGVDPLDGLHGNTQVPKLLGSAARYAYTGDKADGDAARFFWDRVANHHSFATGGHGKDEYFREPDRLSNIVDGRTAETCNVYNMLKLTRRLFALQPKAEYAEFEERALFNHILGSIDPQDGAMCYMVPVGRGYRREYQNMTQSFTCCVGSGMESHALHGDGIYYESGDRLWVNLYAPSTARWEAAGVQLEMQTTFPEGESATATMTLGAPKSFTLALRRPSWAGDRFAVTVNGDPVTSVPAAGSYVEITRTWQTGDTVSLVLPKALRVDPLPDNPHRAAIMWGPLVLAGDLGPEQARPGRGDDDDQAPERPEAPILVTADRPIAEWLKPVETSPWMFQTSGVGRSVSSAGAPSDVSLVPFYRLHRRAYAAYWDLSTPSEYEAMVAARAADAERQRKVDRATLISVPVGDRDAEKAFNQQGEQTTIVRADGRPGRRATKWFSFDVPVKGTGPMSLLITYNSDARQTRTLAILVDGQRIGEQTVEKSSVSRFFDVEYAIPPALTRGKETMAVRFEGTNGNETAPVFGVRVVRATANR